jgi:hypothetical protein
MVFSFSVNARFRVGWNGQWAASAVGYCKMLTDPRLKLLLCAPNVRGIAASALKFINKLRAHVSRKSVFESEQRSYGKVIFLREVKFYLRVNGCEVS